MTRGVAADGEPLRPVTPRHYSTFAGDRPSVAPAQPVQRASIRSEMQERENRRTRAKDLLRDSRAAARAAHLHYVSGKEPGIRRLGSPGRFRYVDARGRRVKSARTLARIRALAIPPAWQDVWISAAPDAHLQAFGFDAAGRKQYRYHPEWRALREHAKYREILPFVRALPRLRERLSRDLASRELTKEKVVALVLSIMQKTPIRIGNEKYAEANGSYGLTTLRTRHARLKGNRVELQFRGKSGKLWRSCIEDASVASALKRCRALRGDALFKYRLQNGAARKVSSNDVNAYIKESMGHPFTAKEFRTWAATLSMGVSLAQCEPCASARGTKQTLVRTLERVADGLGNTVAVCRRSYVAPAVFDCFRSGTLQAEFRRQLRLARRRSPPGLSPEEYAVSALLASPPVAKAREPSKH